MKRAFAAIMAISLLLSACSQDAQPRYTEEQVIHIAQARYPMCFKQGENLGVPSQISVRYRDEGPWKGFWEIQVSCPDNYRTRVNLQDS